MSGMSGYEELVARSRLLGSVAGGDPETMDSVVRTVLSEVLRTLEAVTPEMESALDNAIGSGAVRDWLTALALCPLNPPVQP